MIQLKKHQIEAIRKLKNGSILCGGVGSGKSITALAYYYLLNDGKINQDEYVPMGDPPRDLYIITTARKRDTLEWEKELGHFLLSANPEVNLYSNRVVVDSWNNIKKYKDVHGAFFIFDEQRVVGSGVWVKSFLNITRKNQWILLSATPGDTWQDYIPVFVANKFYKNKTEFEREHVVYRRFSKFPQVDRYLNVKKLTRLRESILVDMDFERKTTAHHKELIVKYDISTYREVGKRRWNPYKMEPIVNAAELCYVLRRVVNSDKSRQMILLELIEKHPKAIIFYNFDYELDILKKLFERYKIAEWNGHKHQPVPKGESWVYLVQYTAGAEGWNCITTDTIIFYSQSYSYKVMVQAAGRIDRLNTPYSDLYYYHLRSTAPIDVAIRRALKNKKDFNVNRFISTKGDHYER